MKKLFIIAALAVAALLPASAQTTYVNVRPTTVYAGTLTNGQTVSNLLLTNWLNYSGFHRVPLVVSMNFTNPVNVANSNITVTAFPSLGSAAGYTNSVFGTNLVFATTNYLTWTFPITTNTVTYTNIDWNFVDGVQLWSFKINTGQTGNSLQFQLDAGITP